MRVAAYIDGFNTYHAIERLGDPAFKWLDYGTIVRSLLSEEDTLERVVFFTALNPWSAEKRSRHINYIKALKFVGVEVVEAKFARPQKYCRPQNRYCKNYEEKQTDVAIAVEALTDCLLNKVDRFLLFTADSDQIPLVKRLRELKPANSAVLLVAPPGRLTHARDLGGHCDGVMELKPEAMRRAVLPERLIDGAGRQVASFPEAYGAYPVGGGV